MQAKILIIDDAVTTLHEIGQVLNLEHTDWEMENADTGRAGLAALELDARDVIISAIGTEGVDNGVFLNQVAERYPEAIRVGLIKTTECESATYNNEKVHKFISAPYNAKQFEKAIQEAITLKEKMSKQRLTSLMSSLSSIPSLPQVYEKLISELDDPECNIDRVAEIVEGDVATCAKMIALVNSAYFGLPRQVTLPKEAIVHLGLGTLKTLILGVAVFSAFRGDADVTKEINKLWSRSFDIANGARIAASLVGLNTLAQEYSYLGGLMCDVGQGVLISNEPEKFAEARELSVVSDISIWEAELQVFGTTHMDVGAYLLGVWGISGPVVSAVQFHHLPSSYPTGKSPEPLTAVHIAAEIIQNREGNGTTLDYTYLEGIHMSSSVEDIVEKITCAIEG